MRNIDLHVKEEYNSVFKKSIVTSTSYKYRCVARKKNIIAKW